MQHYRIFKASAALLLAASAPIWAGKGGNGGKPGSGPGSGDVQVTANLAGKISSWPTGAEEYPGELPGTGNLVIRANTPVQFDFDGQLEQHVASGSLNKFCGLADLTIPGDPSEGCANPTNTQGNLRAQTVANSLTNPLLLDVRMGWDDEVDGKLRFHVYCGRDRNAGELDIFETGHYMLSRCVSDRTTSDGDVECVEWQIEPYQTDDALECSWFKVKTKGKSMTIDSLGTFDMPFRVTVKWAE